MYIGQKVLVQISDEESPCQATFQGWETTNDIFGLTPLAVISLEDKDDSHEPFAIDPLYIKCQQCK